MTAANIAILFAQGGRRVLLVDADLRQPSVHAAFGLRNDIGLTTALVVGNVGLESIAQVTAQPNLSVLTSGPCRRTPPSSSAPSGCAGSSSVPRSVYDLLVVDSPPMQAFSDAAVISALTDGTVLVIDAERGKRRSMQEGRAILARAGATCWASSSTASRERRAEPRRAIRRLLAHADDAAARQAAPAR